jgi:hypothetical protein
MSEPELTLGRFLRALCYRMCFESGMTIYLGGNLWQWQAIFYVLYKTNMPGKPACIKNLGFTPEPMSRSRDVDEAVRALKDSLWDYYRLVIIFTSLPLRPGRPGSPQTCS